MTKKGAKHEKKKYNKKVIIMTFVLMTIFSFLTILSKHSKEPVKPETKTHHSSSFQSSKNARLIRKLPPTLRQLPRRMIKQGSIFSFSIIKSEAKWQYASSSRRLSRRTKSL